MLKIYSRRGVSGFLANVGYMGDIAAGTDDNIDAGASETDGKVEKDSV